MRHRQKLNRRHSNKLFKRGAQQVHPANFTTNYTMRGGTRF